MLVREKTVRAGVACIRSPLSLLVDWLADTELAIFTGVFLPANYTVTINLSLQVQVEVPVVEDLLVQVWLVSVEHHRLMLVGEQEAEELH